MISTKHVLGYAAFSKDDILSSVERYTTQEIVVYYPNADDSEFKIIDGKIKFCIDFEKDLGLHAVAFDLDDAKVVDFFKQSCGEFLCNTAFLVVITQDRNNFYLSVLFNDNLILEQKINISEYHLRKTPKWRKQEYSFNLNNHKAKLINFKSGVNSELLFLKVFFDNSQDMKIFNVEKHLSMISQYSALLQQNIAFQIMLHTLKRNYANDI